MILFLLACAADKAPEADSAALVETPFQPAAGEWQMAVGEAWEGDCALDDMATHQSETQTWVLDPRGDSVNILPNLWELMTCSLDGAELSCDVGSWSWTTARARPRSATCWSAPSRMRRTSRARSPST